ncbi:hypothetical protein ACXZ1K_07625 [Pedobacter sp. PWIIR3]
MTQENQIAETELTYFDIDSDTQYIIGVHKFFMLHICSFGFYSIWWTYKAWRFFIQRDGSRKNAAIRVVFGLFYFAPFCYKILRFARLKGYQGTFWPIFSFIGYFFTMFCGTIGPPIFFIWLLSGFFLIQPLKAFNFLLSQSSEVRVIIDQKLSATEIIILALGGLVWTLTMLGTYAQLVVDSGVLN